MGKISSYLCNLLSFTNSYYNFQSTRTLLYQVFRICSEPCKAAFSYFVPWLWKNLQNPLKLNDVSPALIKKL